ncbi:MAG: ImmA/IrrE family metallo-endopeptidase [Gemmatimonadaceae bacterium]
MIRYKEAERSALALLHTHGVDQPPVDVRAIAEAQGIQVIYQEFKDQVSGMLVRTEEGSFISVNKRHHENRQRFTLAHELAHYALHPNTPTVYVDGMLVHFRAQDVYPADSTEESEANAFAGELLMPREFLRGDLRNQPVDAFDEDAVKALAARYRVSAQALTIRLVEIGLLRGMPQTRSSAL